MQIEQRSDDALLHLAPAFAAGHRGDAAGAAPHLPALVLADLVEGQSGPFAVVDFDHVLAVPDRQTEPLCEDLGGLARALQRARIDCLDLFAGEPSRLHGGFGAAFLGQSDPGQAPVEPAEDRRLSMSQQVKDRHVAVPRRSARGIASCPRVPSMFFHCGRWTLTSEPSAA